jgi:hypothetical protein
VLFAFWRKVRFVVIDIAELFIAYALLGVPLAFAETPGPSASPSPSSGSASG